MPGTVRVSPIALSAVPVPVLVRVFALLGAAGAAILESLRQAGVFDFDWSMTENQQAPDDPKVSDVLKGKKGSIKQAPLPPGSPSWEDLLDKKMSDIETGANENRPGYKEIRKLLRDKRFDK
jgi:hypothetical protein